MNGWILMILLNAQSVNDWVMHMGELNGAALACHHFEQSQRIKMILIENLPKERILGQLFENSTRNHFLPYFNGRPCPSSDQINQMIDQAQIGLKKALGAQE